jgi:hypothetical protein
MSKRTLHEPKRQKGLSRKEQAYILAGFALLVVVAVTLNLISWPKPSEDWNISMGQVLETRVALQRVRPAGKIGGAAFYYRGEAHVTYVADGRPYDLWLPTTEEDSNRDWLAFKMSKRLNDTAEIKWNPAKPSQGVVFLNLPLSPDSGRK